MGFGFDAVANLASAVVSRIWPDKTEEEKQKFTLALQESYQNFQTSNAQVDVNKIEAGSQSIFVSGARPYLMWVCGFAYSWQFVLEPVVSYAFAAFGHPVSHMLVLDNDSLNTLLFGMLGLGGMHAYENVKISKK